MSVVLVAAAAAILIPGALHNLFSTGLFMPHVHCYLDDRRMVWLQGLSDFSIGLSYMAISAALAYLVYKARDNIPFEWMFFAFGIFIFSCGWTHFLEVWTLWHPTYWLSGTVKAITAVASLATAVGIVPLMPRVFRLIDLARVAEQRRQELEKAHEEMAVMNQRLRELDELKSRFFANVSHDLRTPLALILGNTERLREASNLTDEQRRGLRVVEHNGQVLLQQVNNLLDGAKLEAGEMPLRYTALDLASFVRLVCSNFESAARGRGLRFAVQTPETLPAQADAEKLERVLANLLSNALKFTPAGGQVRCSLRPEESAAELEVADSGPGIPAAARATIFDRFRQLGGAETGHFGGTGLGLSIAKDFVELHGGTIQVDQSPEGGARFCLRLPLRAPEGVALQEPAPAARTPGFAPEEPPASPNVMERPGTTAAELPPATGTEPVVLVVEDNPEMAQFIRDTLGPGYQTVSAANGLEGLAKARSIQPDLILTDLMMPQMGGDQLLRRLREERAFDPVPVVVLTARADEQVRVQLLREGAQDYLLKPFTIEELRARASNLIAGKRSRQELQRVNAELEAFSYSLAHDLRAPLRSIRSFALILVEEQGPRLEPEANQFLQNIVNSAQRMDQLISDVLVYTRLDRAPEPMRAVDLEGLLRGLLQEREDLRLPRAEVVINSPLHPVLGQEASLTQVVTNLLTNAVKFVAPGVTPRVEVSTEVREGRVRVWFKDNGIGIPPKDQQRIFGLFERLHSQKDYPGTGLGLSIVRKAIERMGGAIGVESAPGQGSRFWIELKSADLVGVSA